MQELAKNFIYKTAINIARARSFFGYVRNAESRIMVVTDTQILLVQSRGSQKWNFPGGGLATNEDPKHTALRELYEECHIALAEVDFKLGHYTTTKKDNPYHVFIFVAQIQKPITPKPSLEILQAKWFSFDHLPEGLHPVVIRRIHEYRNHKRDLDTSW